MRLLQGPLKHKNVADLPSSRELTTSSGLRQSEAPLSPSPKTLLRRAPSGVTAVFATNPTTGTSMLTLTVSSSATVGPATISISGTSRA